MMIAQTDSTSLGRPIRLWPGVAAAVLTLLVRFALPLLDPDLKIIGVLGSIVGALIILVWWIFFSRAPWLERLGVLALMIVAPIATYQIIHESIRGGMMGMMFGISVISPLALALVAWVVAGRPLAAAPRRALLVVAIVLVCGYWTLLRTEGITGTGNSQLKWRWSETPEQQLLARTGAEPAPVEAASAEEGSGTEWPGFRGPGRDSIARGTRIGTDWSASPPAEIWRRPVGPAWSSFAVRGDRFYTQEQRGEDELVTCYSAATGEPIWIHHDRARFWESNAGAGPRATPSLSDGRVYTFGATGILNAMDAGTGAVIWTRNAATDTGGKVPYWGFSSSPLLVGDEVIVYAGGLAAYDRATGQPRWVGKESGVSYSSPHLATIGGVVQVLQLLPAGAIGVAPDDGSQLWQHAWEGVTIVQPALTEDGDVLIATGGGAGGLGTRRIAVSRKPDGWTTEERWTSIGLKPYFNDIVVHKGHAYGFDGRILSCIDLTDGKRKWKGGRYGHGQCVLLPDQDLLLVLSEEGDLALVGATPDEFKEIARSSAIQGKTWNHPVLAGDLLLVRNDREMAAFRLARAED